MSPEVSRTVISEPGPINPNVDLDEVLHMIQENAQEVMFDMDKAGDILDHAYYEGLFDAYYHIRELLTDPKAWPLAKKTTSLIGDPSTYQVLENHMNEQTAVDIAEAILPETETVVTAVQSTPYFAIGVALGVTATAGAMYLVYRKKKANRETVVVAEPTV